MEKGEILSEILSIERNQYGAYVVHYGAYDKAGFYRGHTQYYGYSKRDALRIAREELGIKRNPRAIRDDTRR